MVVVARVLVVMVTGVVSMPARGPARGCAYVSSIRRAN